MKIVTVSSDRKILEEGSLVRKRMMEYGKLFEEVHIILFTKFTLKRQKPLSLSPNVTVYQTASIMRFLYIDDAIQIGVHIIKDPKETVVITQDPFEAGLAGMRICEKTGAKLHVQVHTDFMSPQFATTPLNKVRVGIARKVLPFASSVRVVSRRVADSIKQASINLKKPALVLPLFVNKDEFLQKAPAFDIHAKYPHLRFIGLIVARLEPEKNIELAINALFLVRQKYPMTGLVIVGDGGLRKSLENKVRTLGLQRNIYFEGWQKDLITYYKTADVYLMTSFFEGYSLSLIEAALSRCPIVSTDVGSVNELFFDNDNILVCPQDNAQCFADNWFRLLNDNALREFLKVNALDTISKMLMSEEEYMRVFKECIETT